MRFINSFITSKSKWNGNGFLRKLASCQELSWNFYFHMLPQRILKLGWIIKNMHLLDIISIYSKININFLIFFYRPNNCYRCIVINERHPNVLQFKESKCKILIILFCVNYKMNAVLICSFMELIDAQFVFKHMKAGQA